MDLSVIILSYNVRHYTWQCVDSVLGATQKLNAEIIVVDNASSDETLALIKDSFPHVRCIANPENIGFSKAYNQAVKKAKGAYLCILNPDTVVGEDVFHRLLDTARSNDKLGAIGPRFIDGRGAFLPECKRVVPTPMGSLKKIIGVEGQNDDYYRNSIAANQEAPAPILAGAFLFLKTSDYLAVKGFDEHYFMYGEDIDLCYKLHKSGKENYYLGTQTIIHYKGESTLKDRQYLERFYGAMTHFYKTHFSNNRLRLMSVSIVARLLIGWRGLWPNSKRAARMVCDTVFWVSLNRQPEDSMDQWLQEKAGHSRDQTYRTTTPQELKKQSPKNALIVFDRKSLTYAMIIELMVSGVCFNQYYRIWHRDRNLLIGSDSSDQQGQALSLD